MPSRVFVTGGSGFVGSSVLNELVARGRAVHALVSHRAVPSSTSIVPFQGNLSDAAVLDEGLAGCDSVIHLVGIIAEKPRRGVTFERIHVEGTRQVVEAARRAGVRRYIQMSALGARTDAPSAYHRTKHAAEQIVRASDLEWTIIRPSMIHGPGGEFLKMVAGWAKGDRPPYLFMPYFGAGLFGRGISRRLQPVYVRDVARAFVDTLTTPGRSGKLWLGGNDAFTWPQFYRLAAEAIAGRTRAVGAVPAWYAKLLTHIVPAPLLPFNRDQVMMSQEDNICDLAPFEPRIWLEARGFEETLADYASELRS